MNWFFDWNSACNFDWLELGLGLGLGLYFGKNLGLYDSFHNSENDIRV